MDLPNPFYDEDDNDGMEPASVACRYRKFNLGGGDAQLVCRTELHGLVKKTQYMTVFALNEFPTPGVPAWRDRSHSSKRSCSRDRT
jgi:translation initiation factor 3 subunit D